MLDIHKSLNKLSILHEGTHSILYYSQASEYGTPVVIKVLRSSSPSPMLLSELSNEYTVLEGIETQGVRRVFEQGKFEDKWALVLEYVEGRSLRQACIDHRLSFPVRLSIAVAISRTLHRIHHRGIYHKHLTADNILVDLLEDPQPRITIIDFGIASTADIKPSSRCSPEVLQGTLQYVSPEQTGRMNRNVDYRTDLYSLGIVLYELFTGAVPFHSENDAMKIVHCHIAVQPPPVCEIASEVPVAVSHIVSKLLSKNAEQRYQSAHGLAEDLLRCLVAFREKGKISLFDLATNDASGKLTIPQQLYGRESQIDHLMAAFDRVCKGAMELVLVTGPSGVGKSTLVNEIHKPITGQRGYFISGKYEQYNRNVPYSALVRAFDDFCSYILTEQESRFEKARKDILEAVGANGRVLTDMFPRLEIIIGEQSAVSEVGPQETQNRFNLVLQQFVRAICHEDHPLVLFVDDLQWADMASLNLLKVILGDDQCDHLLIVGAYRDNEVDDFHPLTIMLDECCSGATTVTEIAVGDLPIDDVTHLVADALVAAPAESRSLAEVIVEQTRGNAFFTIETFKWLYEQNLLAFDYSTQSWGYEMQEIRRTQLTGDVVALMQSKIDKLEPSAVETLTLAALIGHIFDLEILSAICGTSLKQTLKHLWKSVEEGFVLPLDNSYLLIENKSPNAGSKTGQSPKASPKFKFAHDRVLQAAHTHSARLAKIPESEKNAAHLMIGRLLLKNTEADDLDAKIFDIVNQLNKGVALITDDNEIESVARLNLSAGIKAKEATAYQQAIECLKAGIALLPARCWEDQYSLTLSLNTELAEATYLALNFEEAERLIFHTLEKTLDLQDKVRVYEVRIQSLIAQNRMGEALHQGLEVLQMLQIVLPDAKGDYPALYKTMDPLTKGKSVEDFVELPVMTDASHLTAMRILTAIASPAYLAAPDIYPLICFVSVKMCIEHGNSAFAANAYSVHSLILCGMLGQLDEGYRFSQIALKILSKYHARGTASKVEMIAAACVLHWKKHLTQTLPPLSDATQTGLETGDIEYASYSAMYYCVYSFLCGENLQLLDRKFLRYIELMKNLKQEYQIHYTQIWRQAELNLAGKAQNHLLLKGEAFDEEEIVPLLMDANNVSSLFCVYFLKLKLACFFGEHESAIRYAESAVKYIQGVTSLHHFSEYYFYSTLAVLAGLKEGNLVGITEEVEANLEMIRRWEENVPENFGHKRRLIEAEIARISGEDDDALRLYDEAISTAQAGGFQQIGAMASEMAAQFVLKKDGELAASEYLDKAYRLYQKWGAEAKIDHLKVRYSKWLGTNKT